MGRIVFYLIVGVLAVLACIMIYVLSGSWWLGLGISSLLILIVAREVRELQRDKVRRRVRPHGHTLETLDEPTPPKRPR